MEIVKINSNNSMYGAIKINFRQNEGNLYWIYGFKNEEESWDFKQGQFLGVTDDVDLIKLLQENFTTISNDDRFCRSCFEHKKVEKFSVENKCWIETFDDWVPQSSLLEIQNSLLTSIPELNWRNIRTVTNSKFFSYGLCTNCYTSKELNQLKYGRIVNKIKNQAISKYIIHNNDEAILEKYLIKNIDIIEKGMEFIECQKRVDNGSGIIDILGKDINGKLCIIELKTIENDKNVLWQAAYYQTNFKEDIRVIIIAPNYTEAIVNALKNVKNTELKFYELNNEDLLQIKDIKDNTNLTCGNELYLNTLV